MRNLKLTIEYNGSKFFGWQKQNGKRTVQGELEEKLFLLTGEKCEVEGSGRTDRGVHALGQVASVKVENIMPLKNFKRAMNNLLSDDVQIKKIERTYDDFHARFSAKRKTYRYVVQAGGDKSAIKADILAYYPYEKLDFEHMKLATKMLVGKHDFRGFCSADTQVQNFEREIFDFNISKRGRIFTFEVTGNGFLYNMVRILVGTILEIGRGKLTIESVEKALKTGQRKFAGLTMPACGLYLKKVVYQ